MNRLRSKLETSVVFSIVFTALALASACGNNPNPNATPTTRVGQIATYGRTFLLSVEEAQKGLVQLSDQGVVPKDDSVKAMEIFKQIGEAGQKLSAALQAVSQATTPEATTASLATVQTILTNITNLLDTSLIPIGTQPGRQAVAQLIQQVNKTLIELSLQLAQR